MMLLSTRHLSHRQLQAAAWQHGHVCPKLLAAAVAAISHTSAQQLLHPVVYHPDMQISPVPNDHRFPMPKDHLLYLALQQEGFAVTQQQHQQHLQQQQQQQLQQQQQHPTQHMQSGGATASAAAAVAGAMQEAARLPAPTARPNVFTPTSPDVDTLCLVHDRAYVEAFLSGQLSAAAMRRIGLPWSQELVQRTLVGTGSAVLAARLALSYGVAIMCNGGTHHAHRDHGSGWCIFNDLAVAAKAAQRDAGISKVLMLDLDVHQGDGSATIFAGDASVFTFSVHCGAQTFPAVVQQSDWDIALPEGTGDQEYLQVLQDTLPALFDRVRPDLCLYNAGVDIHQDDQLGLLAVSNEGIAARDRMVIEACLAAGVPLAAAIGGGYQKDHAHIVARHMHLHRAAAECMPRFADMMQARRRSPT